jgi:hypothetical protein
MSLKNIKNNGIPFDRYTWRTPDLVDSKAYKFRICVVRQYFVYLSRPPFHYAVMLTCGKELENEFLESSDRTNNRYR